MARKPRIEIPGGLYHIYTRGNNRQPIFSCNEDCDHMLSLLARVKSTLPFYLYAYCLMPNHIHLLVERREDEISRVMHRLLTGYSKFFNQKYSRVGHLFQDRYRALLCDSDEYLAELVRYIHLNPVRAKIVRKPEMFIYSSHRAYIGLSEERLVDTEPVLRHFGGTKTVARNRFETFVHAGMKLGHREELYSSGDRRILGSEEFIEHTIRRIGEVARPAKPTAELRSPINSKRLIRASAAAVGMNAKELCRSNKERGIVEVKEAIIFVGRKLGVSNASLSVALGIHSSTVSRRFDSAKNKIRASRKFKKLIDRIESSVESPNKS
jgi:REP-associated tyrosine transposase